MLENVTRSDTGVYKCVITDTDTWTVKEANTSVFVNCKASALIRIRPFQANVFYQPFRTLCSWLSLSLRTVRADLDPAVVMPGAAADVSQGDELRATCDAPSSLQTDTVWFKVIHSTANLRELQPTPKVQSLCLENSPSPQFCLQPRGLWVILLIDQCIFCSLVRRCVSQ